jgi:death-on-curing protein
MKYLTAEQVLFIHARLIAETGGSHGVRDLSRLESAVKRPQATFDGKELYPDLFMKTAALLDSLVNNHPFMDGNKRTGISSAALFLHANGWHLTAGNAELVEFTLQAAVSHPDLAVLAEWFRQKSKPSPKAPRGAGAPTER